MIIYSKDIDFHQSESRIFVSILSPHIKNVLLLSVSSYLYAVSDTSAKTLCRAVRQMVIKLFCFSVFFPCHLPTNILNIKSIKIQKKSIKININQSPILIYDIQLVRSFISTVTFIYINTETQLSNSIT